VVPGEERHEPPNAVYLGLDVVVFEVAGKGRVVVLDGDGYHFEDDF